MSALKIKDNQNNWINLPGLKGDKGDKGDPGISPTIDSTLSQANQAADAKAVGDKIDEITLIIAPVETTYKATQNYTSGSLFIVDNILYKATTNIANGETITPNTNCTPTTLAEIIAAL